MAIKHTAFNALITSAAAKVLLVQAFRSALGSKGQVFVADIHEHFPARWAADGWALLPPSRDEPAFIEALLDLCRQRDIRLVVPTRDAELPLLARAKPRFAAAGIHLHVADAPVVDLCQDKLAFAAFCAAKALPTLPALSREAALDHLPVFLRPASGAGSIGARRINQAGDLPADFSGSIVTAFVEAPEYTVDLLGDLEGRRVIGTVVRRRIDVVSGESQHAIVENNPRVEAVAIRAATALGLSGHNTLQLFDDAVRGPLLIEINPRFGGAANLGIAAGLDSPARIIRMLEDDASAYDPPVIKTGLRMLRYKQDFLINPDGSLR